MKRFLLIVILISYSITSFGVSLNYFYCCGKLKAVSFAVKTETKDGIAKSKNGCCDNKTVKLKIKDDQKNSELTAFHFDVPIFAHILNKYNNSVASIATYGNINPLYKRLAQGNLPSRNILFCVFRI